MKKYDKAIRLAFNVVALALVMMGIMQAYAPYFGGPDPREAEIREVMHHVITVRSGEVPALLRDPQGKPVMLVLYASWCGPCMVEMPQIVRLMKEGKLDRVKPVFLSMDYDLRTFTAYLVHHDYHTLFPAYLLEGDTKDLQNALEQSGSGYSRHIPYIGFFDRQGKLISELSGMTGREELLETVSSIH